MLLGYALWTRLSRRRGARLVLLATTFGVALYPALVSTTDQVQLIVVFAAMAGVFQAGLNLVFFDELNRVPERLQNALLQVLEEGAATIGPYDVDYPANFIMIATMNPRERAGVEELSDVLLDRFDVVRVGYPETADREKEIVVRYGAKIDGIKVPDDVLDSIISLVRATREEPWQKELEQSASVRASISLYEKVQTMALINKHDVATADDIRSVAVSAMGSRIKPSPESKSYEEPFAFVDELVQATIGGQD